MRLTTEEEISWTLFIYMPRNVLENSGTITTIMYLMVQGSGRLCVMLR